METRASELLFLGPCDFFWGAAKPESMPEIGLPEVAFAGRSNVGKSSLINALTNRKALARISKTPGRTQQLNFFNLGGRLNLVDMPGYGYAKVSKGMQEEWKTLLRAYLRGRPTLRCAFVLIDARHGIKDVDREIMKLLNETGVSYRIVLTKADKAAKEIKTTMESVSLELKKYAAAFPEILVTSAEEKKGIEELREIIADFALKAPPPEGED